MKEELIISGRHLPMIDPNLHVWHWPIYIDLFMGGLAAGLIFFASLYYLMKKEDEMPTAVKWASFLAPVAIIIALICLWIDLHQKMYFWRLYTNFRVDSPMSFGSWILLFITPLSILWSASFIEELFENWNWRLSVLKRLVDTVKKLRYYLAWALLFLSIGLGIYTGILLSAFNARPLWNSTLMGPLFLTYGMLTASAVIMWMSGKEGEKRNFMKLTLILIAVVSFFIFHQMMGYRAGSEVQVASSVIFLGGALTEWFWLGIVAFGLILPAILITGKIFGINIPVGISSVCILIGGFLFRWLIVDAGQMTGYLY